MTLSTSPTSVGSSADVGSSNRRTLGSIVSARAIATRCFWPPERRTGTRRASRAGPTLSRNCSATAIASSRFTPLTRIGASMRLSMTFRCGNRLNSWNTIWARSRIWRICSRWARLRAWSGSAVDAQAVDLDLAHRRLLEEVHAPQQRALAAPRLADEADGLARVDLDRARRAARGWSRSTCARRVGAARSGSAPAGGSSAPGGGERVDPRCVVGHIRTSLSRSRFSSRSWNSDKTIVRAQ